MMNMRSIIMAGLFLCTACTKTEETQVLAAIQPTGACIADIVLATQGVEDVSAIATTCSASVADVAQVIEELLAREPAVDAGSAPVLSAEVKAHLTRLKSACMKDASASP